jgi:DNA-binding MarR family transcriptional regulator
MSTNTHIKNNTLPLDLILDELHREKNRLLAKYLDPYSLGNGQFQILNEVVWHEGISQEGIAQKRNIGKSAVAKSVKRLIENGYIYKERNANDGRAFRLYPTDKGRQMEPTIHKLIEHIEKILCRGSAANKIKQFKATCLQMNANIEQALQNEDNS